LLAVSTPEQQPSETEVKSDGDQNTSLQMAPLPTPIRLRAALALHPCSPCGGSTSPPTAVSRLAAASTLRLYIAASLLF
jgi:hypothetical protein